jgi:hypothetical protein
MAMLEQQPDWSDFVRRAVDDLLADLTRQAATRSESLAVEMQSDIESAGVLRERLESYSMSLLAASGAGTGNLRCNNGSSTVDCAFVLRPDGSPYYRCVHSPPDCYDADYRTIACP